MVLLRHLGLRRWSPQTTQLTLRALTHPQSLSRILPQRANVSHALRRVCSFSHVMIRAPTSAACSRRVDALNALRRRAEDGALHSRLRGRAALAEAQVEAGDEDVCEHSPSMQTRHSRSLAAVR